MKNLVFLLFLAMSFYGNTQESFKKKYKFSNYIVFDGKKTFLSKDKVVPYIDLSIKEKAAIDKLIKQVLDGYTESIELTNLEGKKLIIKEKQARMSGLLNVIGLKKKVKAELKNSSGSDIKSFNGNVLFEKNKLYVNPWNFVDSSIKDDENELYYDLKDGQTAKFKFREFTVSTFTLPLKYRFKDTSVKIETTNEMMETEVKEIKIPETFTGGINISVFGGYTWGKTNFNHRKKIGNKTVTHKHTLGFLLGTGVEKLTSTNTDGSEDAPKSTEEFTIGLLSSGVGYVYSRNKIAVGFFYGYDFGVGSISNTWNYDNRPWLGFGLGYDIFK